MRLPCVFRKTGFTFVEIISVVLLVSLVASSLSTFFFSGLRRTMKGTDRLDSVRAFADLLEAMREDVANSGQIEPAAIRMEPYEETIPSDAETKTELSLTLTDGRRVVYSRVGGSAPEPSLVERIEKDKGGAVASRKTFGADRAKSFKVLHITKKIQVAGFEQELNHVLVKFDLDSEDPRFPGQPLTFYYVLVADRLPGSSWNDKERVFAPTTAN